MFLQAEKVGFKEKLQQIQDICLQIQESMDMVASNGERVKKYVHFNPLTLMLLVANLINTK